MPINTPDPFGPTTDDPLALRRPRSDHEVSQYIAAETVKRVNAALNTADTRRLALQFAVNSVGTAPSTRSINAHAADVLAVADRFRHWIMTGDDKPEEVRDVHPS